MIWSDNNRHINIDNYILCSIIKTTYYPMISTINNLVRYETQFLGIYEVLQSVVFTTFVISWTHKCIYPYKNFDDTYYGERNSFKGCKAEQMWILFLVTMWKWFAGSAQCRVIPNIGYINIIRKNVCIILSYQNCVRWANTWRKTICNRITFLYIIKKVL